MGGTSCECPHRISTSSSRPGLRRLTDAGDADGTYHVLLVHLITSASGSTLGAVLRARSLFGGGDHNHCHKHNDRQADEASLETDDPPTPRGAEAPLRIGAEFVVIGNVVVTGVLVAGSIALHGHPLIGPLALQAGALLVTVARTELT